ncbi:unnamed protein product, partial [Nesidiocoris tenuis]
MRSQRFATNLRSDFHFSDHRPFEVSHVSRKYENLKNAGRIGGAAEESENRPVNGSG